MAPTHKRQTKKPYDKQLPSNSRKTSSSKKLVGGGDVESTSNEESVSLTDYNKMTENVKRLEDSMTKILASLTTLQNQFQDRDPDINHSTNQPRGVDSTALPDDLNTQGDHTEPMVTTEPIQTNDIEDTVDDNIQKHLQIMMGGPITTNNEGKNFRSIALPIDLHISDKIKQKIWAGEYIDLNTINDKNENLEYTMKITNNQQGPYINFVPTKQGTTISNIAQWFTAFDIFMVIYCKKYTNEISNLMTYRSKIRNLSSKGGDWIRYDIQYRKMKAIYNMNWEIPHFKLWLDCSLNPPKINNNNNTYNRKPRQPFRQQGVQNKSYPTYSTTVPAGFCFNYHSGRTCQFYEHCNYSHKCFATNCKDTTHSYAKNHKKETNNITKPNFTKSNSTKTANPSQIPNTR
jgi:hypothetical protein